MRSFVALILLAGIAVGVYMYKSEDGSQHIKAEMSKLIDDMPIKPEWKDEAAVLFSAVHEKAFQAALDVTQRLGKKFDDQTYYDKVFEMMERRAREEGKELLAEKLEKEKSLFTFNVTER